MTDCIWTWEQDSYVLSVHVCAAEHAMIAKFMRGEDAITLEVPYDLTVDELKKKEELRKKFAEVLTSLFLRRK